MSVEAVGIDNSINAVLLAIRILRAFDVAVQKGVGEFVKGAKEENLKAKGSRY
jgi:phosphoribosylaminoimidazole carboxylase